MLQPFRPKSREPKKLLVLEIIRAYVAKRAKIDIFFYRRLNALLLQQLLPMEVVVFLSPLIMCLLLVIPGS
jgi:hypothetical protein